MPPIDPARLNAVGDLVLTDSNELRALADPQRLALFDLVRREGPATSSTLARRLDRDAAWIDENLGALEGLGLVESDAGAGEVRWSAAVRGIYFEIPDDPEGEAAARALSGVMMAKYADLPAAWVRDQEPQLDVEWARAAGLFNARIDLTPAELQTIQEGLERLLEPFTTRSSAEIPSAAAPVRILAFFMPE
ncbi:MAG TPA: helix-turn-helix domain-containing protein [Gaiellaceae bacterium]|jgi:predicted transcriptional regulator